MAWYDSGTVAVTNGSTTVTGTGTNFITGAQAGEGFYGPDDKLYEIASITSATALVLADSYLGSTQSGQDYKIVPTQSLVADLASDVTDLISDYADVKDKAGAGKFNDGSVTSPAITFEQDQNNGLYRIGSDNYGLSAGGTKQIDISTTDVELNYSGSKKLATTSTGVDVTGTVTADGLTVDGNSNLGIEGSGSQVTMQLPSLSSSYPTRLVIEGDYNSGTSDVDIKAIGVSSGGPYGANLNFYTSSQTSVLNRMKIANNGDVQFFEDSGTTAKMVWDASAESLGIGTSSPSYTLDVAGKAGFGLPNTTLPALGDDTANFRIGNLTGGNINYGTMFGTVGTGDGYIQQQRFDDNATAYDLLLQPNGGNVGIGTASPDTKVDIDGTTSYPKIKLQASSNTSRFMQLGMDDAINYSIEANGAGTNLLFKTVGSERARIDSSGNLLVGTTNVNMHTASTGDGVVATSSGRLYAASTENVGASTTVGVFNRISSDGNLVQFKKNGSTVGSIGTSGGDLDIGTGDTVIRFNDGIDAIFPVASVGGVGRNGAVDLGFSGARFKDLYLSGGVYLGGTGAANKLDDYEEGVWTGAITLGNNLTGTASLDYPKYVKVGNQVHLYGHITGLSITSASSESNLVITVPFSSAASYSPMGGSVFWSRGRSNGIVADNTSSNSTTCFIALPSQLCTDTGSTSIFFSIYYQTS